MRKTTTLLSDSGLNLNFNYHINSKLAYNNRVAHDSLTIGIIKIFCVHLEAYDVYTKLLQLNYQIIILLTFLWVISI